MNPAHLEAMAADLAERISENMSEEQLRQVAYEYERERLLRLHPVDLEEQYERQYA